MSGSTCFICKDPVPGQQLTKETQGTGKDYISTSGGIASLPDVVFLLRILFKVPHQVVAAEILEDNYEHKSTPGNRHHPGRSRSGVEGAVLPFLKLCEVCEESVDHARSVHRILTETVASFRKVQNKLTEKLKKSHKKTTLNGGRLKGNGGDTATTGNNEELRHYDTGRNDKLREFVIESNPGTRSANGPFQIEDLTLITKDLECALESPPPPASPLPVTTILEEDVKVKYENTPDGIPGLTPLVHNFPGHHVPHNLGMMESAGSGMTSTDQEFFEDENDDGEVDDEEEMLVSDLQEGSGNDQVSIFVQDRISLPISANHNSHSPHLQVSTPSSSSSSSSKKHYYYDYKCEICLRSFSRPNRLHKHMASQHGISVHNTPFHVCNTCNRCFKQDQALREHLQRWRGQCGSNSPTPNAPNQLW